MSNYENPLIPNKKLKELYTIMLEARRSVRRARGTEACLAATASHLRPTDSVAPGSHTASLRLVEQTPGHLLPADSQLAPAIGAAVVHKQLANGSIAVAYLDAKIDFASIAKLLQFAVEENLPLLVIQLPGEKPPSVASKLKIPIIPVDANDAVAIYRVMQESATRARTLGGVTWICCVQLDSSDPIKVMEGFLTSRGLI